MNSRLTTFIHLALACSLSFVLMPSGVTAMQQGSTEGTSTQQEDSLPLFTRYGILFRRLAGSQPRVQESRPTGKTRESHYRDLLQREVHLSDEQSRALEEIAGACQRRIADVDARAKAIIDAFRAQHPRARPTAPGEQSPPLPSPPARPPELAALQEERRSIILHSREQLRAAFGEEVFKRFDGYVTSHGNGRAFTLPPRDRPAISMQATTTALSADGLTARKQFRAGEKIVIRIALLNNSSHSINVRQVDLYDWFEVSRIEGNSREAIFIRPPDRAEETGAARIGQMQSVELMPGQKTIAGTLDLSNSLRSLRPGRYVVAPHPHVLLNRPPDKSEFIDFTSADDPVTFEVVP